MSEERYVEWDVRNNPSIYRVPQCDELIDLRTLTHVICNLAPPDGVEVETFGKAITAVIDAIEFIPCHTRESLQKLWVG